MRVAYHKQLRFDCPPIETVELNLKSRDEIIPVLRTLQYLYIDACLRDQLLTWVGQDVNGSSSCKLGRRGLDYWMIVVLAAVWLGCDLDDDKLQNLAEEHRTLRFMMGLGDWIEDEDFDWRRIRDNVCLLRPETLEKLNPLVIGAGHLLVPKAIKSVRGDTFVVGTNIHYPTESGLIGDGLRKVVMLVTKLAAVHGQSGCRQHQHLLKSIKEIVRRIGRAARAKGLGADRLKPGYKELLDLAEDLMSRASQLLKTVACCVDADVIDWLGEGFESPEKELLHYLQLTRKVCGTAKRRVLLAETIPNEEKLFSIFEPHTELIKRGKQPDPIQYGHKVLVIEDAIGFICAYQVVANGGLDQEILVPAMTQLQKRMGGKIKRASFDRGFHTPDSQKNLAEIVAYPCIPKKGQAPGRKQRWNFARLVNIIQVWNRRSEPCKPAMVRSAVGTRASVALNATSAWASWAATFMCWASSL
ncbi:MAG: ISNCY family transposase [Planctomycetaceae bacterium]|nr:ISNCY family transposase [Planctomycetaceae bacterium]